MVNFASLILIPSAHAHSAPVRLAFHVTKTVAAGKAGLHEHQLPCRRWCSCGSCLSNAHELEQVVSQVFADCPSLYLCATATCCRGCFSAKAVGQAADLQASLLSHRNGAVQARVLQLVLSSVSQSAERHSQGEAGQAEALLFDLATVRAAVGTMGPAGHLQVWQTLVPLVLPEGALPLLSQPPDQGAQGAYCKKGEALWLPHQPGWKGQAMWWLSLPPAHAFI